MYKFTLHILVAIIGAIFVAISNAEAQTNLDRSFGGTVYSSGNKPLNGKRPAVAKATVHLVPVEAVSVVRLTANDLRTNSDRDEPLEDAIRNAETGVVLNQVTDNEGRFKFENVAEGKYFLFVTPGLKDRNHLPGGDMSRKAISASALWGINDYEISISSGKFRANDKFVGSQTCVGCHQRHANWDTTGQHWNRTAHKLGWSRPGDPGANQDFTSFPTWFQALEQWRKTNKDTVIKEIEAARSGDHCAKPDRPKGPIARLPKNPPIKPTHLEIGDYKYADGRLSTAGFKIRVACDPLNRIEMFNVYADILLWSTDIVDGQSRAKKRFFITIANRLNPTDKHAIVHLPLELVYGGGVHRQRYIVSVPEDIQETYGKRVGHYTLLQFNIDGRDEHWDQDRRVWRDYKLSYWWDFEKDLIRPPNVNQNTIEAECAGCHVTGAKRISHTEDDPIWAGQVEIGAIPVDPGGAFDITGDGILDEVNVGCESCHGPGNAHNQAVDGENEISGSTHIINPRLLSAERADLICGRCHDRRQAAIPNAKTQAVNINNEFFPAGEARQTIVTEYSAPGKAAPLDKHLWDDRVHSRSPRQQYSEHVRSKHYANPENLVSCSDCHAAHGETSNSSWLKGDPEDPYSPLCQNCHNMDSAQHMHDVGHPRVEATAVSCISCHMVGTSRPGGDSGQMGLFAKRPPFQLLAEERDGVYWEGNLNSHVFDVPTRNTIGVWGKKPFEAMPVPYTNSCGVCHNVSAITDMKPNYGELINYLEKINTSETGLE